MNDTNPNLLQYSRQPPGSIAQIEFRDDGGVRITIPPPIRRPLGKILLAGQVFGCIAGPLLWVACKQIFSFDRAVALGFLAMIVTSVSFATLPVTLWMGMRWTLIEAGAEGLHLHLRGLVSNRNWFLPREKIGSLKKNVSLIVYDPHGRRIAKIDATTPKEEIWVMEMLGRAMNVPIGRGSL
jgi:hypothetical protein